MPAVPRLTDLLALDRVLVDLDAPSRDAVLDAAIARLTGLPAVRDPAQLAADVVAREARMSTGVGEGLALPHARTSAVASTVATVCTLATPVDWDAHDGAPVDLVLLFAGPEGDRGAHVRLLAHISRVLSPAATRRRLADASTPADLLAVIAEAEG
ncbi:PTS sugar transporter subunit IIA [Rubrivirga sp.]|uniref:PTS sugar transporter subunit IIA n=1 Tax=Rubrivirga sp. TaxID=1885344 RepID=UPI003B523EAF